jgi:hypothetical protein
LAFEYAVNTELTINDHFAIMPAFGYERKGSSDHIIMLDMNGQEAGTAVVKINYDYLIFPLLLKYYPSEKRQFYLSAGPYFSHLLSCKEKNGSQTIDIKDQVQNFDFGVAAGFGFIYPLTENFALDCGTRFNIGLLNTQKLDIYGDGEPIRTFSLGFLSCLKYKF